MQATTKKAKVRSKDAVKRADRGESAKTSAPALPSLGEEIIAKLCARTQELQSPNTLALGVLLERLTGVGAAHWPREWHEAIFNLVVAERRRRGDLPPPRCGECGGPADERVDAGMKCGRCAYG